HDGSIRLVEVGNGRTRLVGHSGFGEARHPRFSPDGRYLVWSQPTQGEELLAQLMVVDVKSDRQAQPVTTGKYNDFCPTFTRDGKYIAFLSDRTFDPAYNQHAFDLSFNGVTRPWLLPLTADEPAPFGPSATGWAISEAADEPAPDGQAATGGAVGEAAAGPRADRRGDEKPAPASGVESEGAEERIVPSPVSAGVFRDLEAFEAGLLWMRAGVAEGGEFGS